MCGLAVLTAVAQCDPPQVSVASTAGSVCEGGSVTLQVSVSNASQNLPEPPVAVGDVLCSDNSIVKISSWPVAGKTAIGVVFYVDNTGEHGWAVNLQEQEAAWCASYPYPDVQTMTNITNLYTAFNDFDGYGNTQKMRNAGTAATYPAAYAVNFAQGWYLPAIGQMNVLFAEYPRVNVSLQAVGGTQLFSSSSILYAYWSSSEYSDYSALAIVKLGFIHPEGKGSQYEGVRGVKNF